MQQDRFEFRVLEQEQAADIVKWNEGKDADFLMQWAGRGFTYPITIEQVIKDMKICSAAFAIMKQGEMVGTISLLRVDEKAASGYIGHFLLNPALTGRGMGTAIIREFIIYCFGILRLKELTLRVYTYNLSALRCYEKNGFTEVDRDHMDNGLEALLMRKQKTKTESSTDTSILICDEKEEDYYATELMTQHAFWNLHWPGCNEHLLVYNLRSDDAYIPELSKIAKIDGEVAGAILYSKAYVVDVDGTKHEVLTFGPLCVEPRYQSLGIGGKLLSTTMEQAKAAGYPAIIILGEPGYYPRFGFKTCDHFGITTPEGKNFDAFMGIELQPGALESIKGKFYEADVFGDGPEEEVAEFDRKYPQLIKYRLPGQWEK